MLTHTQRDLIKATVPLLESGGEALTTHFYRMMLSDHPEVRPLFNQAHQASGDQPRALANGVLMYARHIDRLEALGPLVGQIVSKHVSLQILPEHYPIVGGCLLRAIREVLGAEIATDAVIEAWAVAYQQLADIFIGAEEQLYTENAAAPGGWRGARSFFAVPRCCRLRRLAACALLRPSAIASAKLANSTVNHNHSALAPMNQVAASPSPNSACSHSAVISAAQT